MKLFVWKDVLCDYTCGMIVVLAEDEGAAIRLIREKSEFRGASERDAGSTAPEVYELDKPLLFEVFGGG